jgi:glycosyltransferase involved in cell wall biosynthesis
MESIIIDARESGTSTGRYVDKLIEHLHKLKPEFNMTILTKTPRVDFIKKIAPNFEVIESSYKEFTFAEQIGFLRQVKKLDADLVHFAMTQQPIRYRGKAVTTIHDLTTARFGNPSKNRLIFKIKQLVYKRVIKKVVHKSDAIITPTEFVRQDVASFTDISPEKIVVTYEAADKISEAPEPIKSLDGKRFIMYAGRPQPHKNLGRLIDAFEILQKNHPDLWLVLVGKEDALYQCHEEEVKKRGIKNVMFTGFVSEGQLRWLYENTAAYIFPSLSEGFGLPGLEAMCHGAPVVSSNATCLPEVYEGAAKYFDPKNVQDMAESIEQVLNNKDFRNKLIEKGYEQAKKYSWEKMATQTLEIYNKALKN